MDRQITIRNRSIGSTVLLAALMAVTGCSGVGLPNRSDISTPRNQSEAASTHLAVLARKEFTEEVITSLSPSFENSGAKALENSVPLTGLFVDLLRREQRGRIDVKVSATPDGLVTAPALVAGGATNTPLSVDTDGIKSAFDKQKFAVADPFTHYSTANALYQEIGSLNNYLKSYPRLANHTPYLVRLQLSVIPKRRNLPYDVYSDLTFFSGSENGRNLIVPSIPIFASENIERGLDQRTRELIRSFAASGAGVVGNASLGGTASSSRQENLSAIANEFNGLLTIGRVTENVTRVRFGALQNSANSYEMIPRTHNITLMLMIPNGAKSVQIKATQVMRRTDNGEILPRGPSGEDFIGQINGIFDRFKLRKTTARPDLCSFTPRKNDWASGILSNGDRELVVDFVRKRLRPDLAKGDYDKFRERVNHCLVRDPSGAPANDEAAVELWTQLATVQAELPDSFVSFEVPTDKKDDPPWRATVSPANTHTHTHPPAPVTPPAAAAPAAASPAT